MIAALTDTADEHFHLLRHISPRELDGGHDDIFETDRSAAACTNEMDMIITVAPTGTIVFA